MAAGDQSPCRPAWLLSPLTTHPRAICFFYDKQKWTRVCVRFSDLSGCSWDFECTDWLSVLPPSNARTAVEPVFPAEDELSGGWTQVDMRPQYTLGVVVFTHQLFFGRLRTAGWYNISSVDHGPVRVKFELQCESRHLERTY
jgi:hypothetical protein